MKGKKEVSMKAVHVCSGLDVSFGGPSYTISSLCNHLTKKNILVEIHALESKGKKVDATCKQFFYPILGPRKIGYSPEMLSGLIERTSSKDILHSHGIWMAPNIYPLNVKRKKNCSLIISPRGMLSEWSLNRSKHVKNIAALLGQKKTLMSANCLHATAISEYEDIRQYDLKQPVTIIPNGVDIPSEMPVSNKKYKKLLFLSRIHPKKGIERLIILWEAIETQFPEWELVICGPGEESYLKKVIRLIAKKKNIRISYHPPVYGNKKSELYYSSDLFILPTFSENFGVVVAEALAHSVPAIVTDGAPWSGLIDKNCGWWVENTDEALLSALKVAMATDKSILNILGENGKNWMKEDYSWDAIAEKMLQTYRWINGDGAKPNCVVEN